MQIPTGYGVDLFLLFSVGLATIGVCVFCAAYFGSRTFYFLEVKKMKKLLALSLAICMLFCLVACGSNNPTDTASNSQIQTNENAENNKQSENTEKLNKFQQFEKGLTDKNIQFEVTSKAATMVGAKEGYGYSFADETSVEIYLFDTSSDAYKEAFKNNKLNLVDFGITMDVVFNGDICIYFDGEPTNKSDIQTIFNNIK